MNEIIHLGVILLFVKDSHLSLIFGLYLCNKNGILGFTNYLHITGQGGLEVRCDGARPAVPMDIHDGGGGGHGRDHPPGPQPLRRPQANRQGAFNHWHCGWSRQGAER